MARKKKTSAISMADLIREKIAQLGDTAIERKRKQILLRQLAELEGGANE